MEDWGRLVLGSLWLILPFGIANMAPVLFRNILPSLAKPVDGGIQCMGKPIFGAHKTWRGIIFATVVGGLVYLIQLALYTFYQDIREITVIDYWTIPAWAGFVIGFGAIFGDLIKSFFKRRISVRPGEVWFPFDQIDFLLGGLLATSVFAPLAWQVWIIVLVGGIGLHMLANNIGYWIGIKETRW